MNQPSIPVSWGELFDKITILRIKREQITDPAALANVENEYDLLNQCLPTEPEELASVTPLFDQLYQINRKLWDIEDRIREKEQHAAFDEEFISLARSVYFTNDKRAQLKREINLVLKSNLVEEKSYQDYTQNPT